MPRTTWSELAVAVFNVDVDNPLSLPSSSCISFSFLAAFAFFVMVVGFLRLFKNQNSDAGASTGGSSYDAPVAQEETTYGQEEYAYDY